MKMRLNLHVIVLLFLCAIACLPVSGALADCSVSDTRAIVLDWESFNPFWDEDATDSVLAALQYWGIGDEDDEVFFQRQPEITNDPPIHLSDIEDHLPGKRIAYFNTHGGADTSFVGFLAVEYYRDFDPFKDAYLSYVDRGYEQNLDIGWAIRRLGENSVYTILLLPAGIYYRFNGLMERGDSVW